VRGFLILAVATATALSGCETAKPRLPPGVRPTVEVGPPLKSEAWKSVATAEDRDRLERLGLDPRHRAGKLSGGQRAQLALTLGLAKRPELLILDEPVAALDPLARREFLQGLMEAVAEHELSVVLSSHLVSDLERTCDYLIVLVGSRVRAAGEVEELLATHHRLTGPRRDPDRLPAGQHVVSARHTDRQSTLIVRTDAPIHDPAWSVSQVTLEDLVLAYMDRCPAEHRRVAQEVEG
jgi:ABC-2 type transport system ATP-binding protein